MRTYIGNSTQYSVMAYEGKEANKECVCIYIYIYIYVCVCIYIYITDSLCYTAETNTLQINYTPLYIF